MLEIVSCIGTRFSRGCQTALDHQTACHQELSKLACQSPVSRWQSCLSNSRLRLKGTVEVKIESSVQWFQRRWHKPLYKCLLDGGLYKPPFGDCAIYFPFTVKVHCVQIPCLSSGRYLGRFPHPASGFFDVELPNPPHAIIKGGGCHVHIAVLLTLRLDSVCWTGV